MKSPVVVYRITCGSVTLMVLVQLCASGIFRCYEHLLTNLVSKAHVNLSCTTLPDLRRIFVIFDSMVVTPQPPFTPPRHKLSPQRQKSAVSSGISPGRPPPARLRQGQWQGRLMGRAFRSRWFHCQWVQYQRVTHISRKLAPPRLTCPFKDNQLALFCQ